MKQNIKKTLKADVSEIFQSFQGEGPYAGVRQVFVRLFGCHMHCAWCDTPESIGDTTREFTAMTLGDVFRRTKNLYKNCHSVSLTGGEPLLQVDFIQKLIPFFKRAGMPVYLETSGVLYQALAQIVKTVDIVSMDIKIPSSTGQRAFWNEHEEFLKILVNARKEFFVKIVISSLTRKAEVLKTARMIQSVKKDALLILQPNSFDLACGVMQKCDDYQRVCNKILPWTRVMPQMHKFLKIR